MASSVIHMAIASEINKVLCRNYKFILIGSIAPDLSRLIDHNRNISHFITDTPDIPNLNKFLAKYKQYLNDDFVLGYYIHLYTDYIWFKYYLTDFIKDKYVYDKNNAKLKLRPDKLLKYIYNDYNSLNIKLIKKYKLDLNIFDNKYKFKNIIKEIPINKVYLLLNNTKEIINNSKETETYLFNIYSIEKFISFTVQVLLDDLKSLDIYKV